MWSSNRCVPIKVHVCWGKSTRPQGAAKIVSALRHIVQDALPSTHRIECSALLELGRLNVERDHVQILVSYIDMPASVKVDTGDLLLHTIERYAVHPKEEDVGL